MANADHERLDNNYKDKEKFFDTILARTDKSEQAINLITLMDIAWSLRVIAINLMEKNHYYYDYAEHYVDGNYDGSKVRNIMNKVEEDDSSDD